MNGGLSARSLCAGYDGRALLKDVNLTLRPGEVMALIGPNGAGKTTLLKTLAAQLKALGGRVLLAEREIWTLKPGELARRMAVLLTERQAPEKMTCREVAAAGRYPYTGRLGLLKAGDEARVAEALRAFEALDLADRPFTGISDGQRQRVLLARALCQEPEVLLLDEPASFLDIQHKLRLMELLRGAAREKGIAVLMSVHEIELALRASDRVACLDGRGLTREGAPEEVCTEANMRALYGLPEGAYDPAFGVAELPGAGGAPRALVLSCGGSGIPVYRRLRRQGVPFAAAILYTNDLDFHLARRLAAEVVSERPFEPIGDAAVRRALQLVESCETVIDAGVTLGSGNARMREVLLAAEGKRIRARE